MSKQKIDPVFLPVYKVPLVEILPGYNFNSGHDTAVVVETPEGKKIVNFCSEDYGLTPNKEIFDELTRRLDKEGFKYEKVLKHRNYSKYFLDVVFESEKYNISPKNSKVGDIVNAKIRLLNSYDGSRRYGFQFGFYRKVCSNGLVAFEGEQLNKRHTKGFSLETGSVDETMRVFSNFLSKSEELLIPYRTMAKKEVSEPELLLATMGKDIGLSAKKQLMALERMQLEIAEHGYKCTNWLVYNAVNYSLYNFSDKIRDNKVEKIDKEIYNYLLNNATA